MACLARLPKQVYGGWKCVPYNFFILFALVWGLSRSAWCQSPPATIIGSVTDPSGRIVPGARVMIVNRGVGSEPVALTDTVGQYRLVGLPAGIYSVRVEKDGFQAEVRESIAVTAGSEVRMNFSLTLGDVSQEVVVRGDAGTFDPTSSTAGGLVNEQELADLPLNGRDLFRAVVFEPGVATTDSSAPSLFTSGKTGQVAINGTRSNWTSLLIDGMDANDPVFGFSPAGASGLFLGLNELAEVQVLTQTLGAEYGGAGAVVDAVTKSGTNKFHGSLFELYRGATLDAKNYFDAGDRPIPPLVRNQFGAALGGPLAHNRTFFFVNYEGFREVQASTAIATVPNAASHRGLLPAANSPGACSGASTSGCVSIGVDPRVQPFLNLLPIPNEADNGDGTGNLITEDKGAASEHHGMIRLDHRISSAHSFFARYTIDEGISTTPSFGDPPGTYVPGFPVAHHVRNQYSTIQEHWSHGNQVNEVRFGVNRTTATTADVNALPGQSISLDRGRPFGMLDVTGLSLIGNSPFTPLGDFSTNYQLQDQLSLIKGRHSLKFGVEGERLQLNGFLDFVVNGLYEFQDLSPFGLQARSNNPALEFFLQALPLSYAGAAPSGSNSHRSYRQTVASGFAQDSVRITSRFTLSLGLRYEFYSNPTETHGRLSVIRNPISDSGPTVGNLFAATPSDLLSPHAGFAWNLFGDGKTIVRSGAGIFRDNLPEVLYSEDRFLAPFVSLESFAFPTFLNPQNALVIQPLTAFSATYHPKFPSLLQYNLRLDREAGRGIIFSTGYFGSHGSHLPRLTEANPFELSLGRRYNPNLPSPFLSELTDAQSFYNSLQLSISEKQAHGLSWQAFYTWSHSTDDASTNISEEAVNEPIDTQDPFNRKGSRGRSGFDIRQNFVANVTYELPFWRGRRIGGWQVSMVTSIHSNLPFTPVLSFDNADLQSLVISERPNLVSNPYVGTCPNGSKVGTPSCWFNPSAFVLPLPGQFGNAGRNILRGPTFSDVDLVLQKSFQWKDGPKLTLGAEAFNLFNHPNFGVPTNTQSPLSLGGNGEAIFKDPAGDLASNAGRILATVGTGRQIQITARLTF